jgi:hypothetical protein
MQLARFHSRKGRPFQGIVRGASPETFARGTRAFLSSASMGFPVTLMVFSTMATTLLPRPCPLQGSRAGLLRFQIVPLEASRHH